MTTTWGHAPCRAAFHAHAQAAVGAVLVGQPFHLREAFVSIHDITVPPPRSIGRASPSSRGAPEAEFGTGHHGVRLAEFRILFKNTSRSSFSLSRIISTISFS